jgi:hypothetical protein
MKKIIVVVCAFIFVSSLMGCEKKEDVNKDKGGEDINKEIVEKKSGTSIYLVKLNEAELNMKLHNENIPMSNCGNELVEINLEKTLSPQEALEQLFTYKEYDKEKGIFNVFAVADNLKLKNLLIKNDFAIVTLAEGLNLPEQCNDMQVYAQIRKTLSQFDEIAGVDILVGEEELRGYLSAERDKRLKVVK